MHALERARIALVEARHRNEARQKTLCHGVEVNRRQMPASEGNYRPDGAVPPAIASQAHSSFRRWHARTSATSPLPLPIRSPDRSHPCFVFRTPTGRTSIGLLSRFAAARQEGELGNRSRTSQMGTCTPGSPILQEVRYAILPRRISARASGYVILCSCVAILRATPDSISLSATPSS
jgi:hypothetical protein